MKKQSNLFVGSEARYKLMNGVRKAANVVGCTMGSAGSNSLIECLERPGHYTTNDGATILENIKFADPLEEMGRQILFEAVSRANKASGDGSSTTCVLTAAILEEGMKYIGEASPLEIKKGLEACIPIIEKSIKAQKRDITVNEVAQVASISAQDEKIGKTIQEIYQKIGKDGIISWDISKTAEDSYTIGTGLTISGATYAAPFMANAGNEVRLKNPYILLVRKKITSGLEFETLFKDLFNRGVQEIAVFCDDIDIPVLYDLAQTQRIRGFKTVVVKMPVLWKDEWWTDLSKASGATVLDVNSGIKLSEVGMDILGKVRNIRIDREDTYIDGINDLTAYRKYLTDLGDEASLIRTARLNTKTARYYVGAHSETALAYKRLKVEDAINAASCALEDGIVAGGGIALWNIIDKLNTKEVGSKILKKALSAPIQYIAGNAGIKEIVKNKIGGNIGINSKTREIVNMLDTGIVDPTSVVINAVKNAIGVAASILTTETVITLPKNETKPL